MLLRIRIKLYLGPYLNHLCWDPSTDQVLPVILYKVDFSGIQGKNHPALFSITENDLMHMLLILLMGGQKPLGQNLLGQNPLGKKPSLFCMGRTKPPILIIA